MIPVMEPGWISSEIDKFHWSAWVWCVALIAYMCFLFAVGMLACSALYKALVFGGISSVDYRTCHEVVVGWSWLEESIGVFRCDTTKNQWPWLRRDTWPVVNCKCYLARTVLQ